MRRSLIILLVLSLLLASSCGSGNTEMPSGESTAGENTSKADETSRKPESESAGESTAVTSAPDSSEKAGTTEIPVTSAPETSANEMLPDITRLTDDDIRAIITNDLGKLSSSQGSMDNEKEIIAENPEVFEEIMSFGERAIPFLDEIISDNKTGYTLGCIAKYAAYTLDPSRDDLVFESPDKKVGLRLSVGTFMGSRYNYDISPTYDRLTLTTAASPDNPTVFALPDYTVADVSWSDGGKYAVLIGKQKNDRSPSPASLIDTLTGKMTALPELEIYNRILESEPGLEIFLSFAAESCEWSEGNPTVGFELKVGAAFYPRKIHGKYTFNTKTNEIINVTYDPLTVRTPDETLTDEEIKKAVDENLDILTADDSLYAEDKIIAAHPEAFENILALGNGAVEYLNEIGKGYKHVGEDTSGNNRCFTAKAAAYVINPDADDLTFASPDGRYELKASVYSFSSLADPFSGVDYKLCLRDSGTKAVISALPSYFGFSPSIYDQIYWSPDSEYVGIEQGYRHYFTSFPLLSAESGKVIEPPGEGGLEDFLGLDLTAYDPEHGFDLDNTHIYPDEWGDGTIRIRVEKSGSVGVYADIGWYIYDIENEEIIEADFGFITYPPELYEKGYLNAVKRYRLTSAGTDISASYPVLNGGEENSAIAAINEQIHDYVISDCEARKEKAMVSETRCEVTRLDEEAVGVRFIASYEENGTAREESRDLTFDLKTGEEITE